MSRDSKRLFNLYSRANQLVIDACIFATSLAGAYLVRFESLPDWPQTKQFLLFLPYVIAARLIVNWASGIYRLVWRYTSLPEALAIARSLTVVSLMLVGLRLFYPASWSFSNDVKIPLGVIVLDFLFCFTGTVAARALRRIQYERGERLGSALVLEPKRLLLYGAGRAGIALARHAKNRADVEVVGFLDDKQKVGTVIAETRVLGGGDLLERIAATYRVDQVVITMTSPPPDVVRKALTGCRRISATLKVVPDLQALLLGHARIEQIHDVRIEDLLGRESVDITRHEPMIRQMYSSKRIAVTGAGGSIGAELVRQLMRVRPVSVALLDKDENAVYELQQELLALDGEAKIEPRIVDIRSEERLQAVFMEFNPQIVFHAAAHKHVPLMEENPCEAVLNNVGGTEVLLRACRSHRVEQFVYISSDKAVNPANIMGATKRIGEMMVRASVREGGLSAATVRFGNVLGSRGSVIPLFQQQIARGGPVAVTHPDVTRYFMTIPEAVHLVLCAGALGRRGETFVLDMGTPRKIVDVAHELISLAGLEVGKDIEVTFTGLRPGEKLNEELVESKESVRTMQVEKLWMVEAQGSNHEISLDAVNQLISSARQNDHLRILTQLHDLGIGFRAPDTTPAVQVVGARAQAAAAASLAQAPLSFSASKALS
jgi:FlaA1/EpsC-like NDP-sugar epimerase